MVWVLGLLTLSALIWLIAGMMATESDAERRRHSESAIDPSGGESSPSRSGNRRAA